MVDLVAAKEIGGALQWMLTLGASDTKSVRQETEDLLVHCSATLKSLVELNDALNSLDRNSFTDQTFARLHTHCSFNYTSPEAAFRARTNCRNIQRDIERITFKLTVILRTDLGQWNTVNEGFGTLSGADDTFLDRFEGDMKHIQESLDVINLLMHKNRAKAWDKFEALRKPLLEGMGQLRSEIETMQKADEHIRRLLT